MKFLKFYFRLLDRFSPRLAAKRVYHLLSHPRIRKLRNFEEEILDQSQRSVIKYKSFDIQSYIWGSENDKTVFLIHGWEGQAGNFGGLVAPLLEKGYRIIAYDAPSHGRSSKGTSEMFDFAEIISGQLEKYQPQVIISHSFGSVISATVIRNNPSHDFKNWIMVTTPHKYIHYIKGVTDFLGISKNTFDKVISMIESKTQESIEDLDMVKYCGQLKNVEKATIIHSKKDRVIPIKAARVVHEGFPQSELIELDNLGHYSILWSDQLKTHIETILN